MTMPALGAEGMARRLVCGEISDVPHEVLYDLLGRIREELARRDVQALVDGLRRYLSRESPDAEVRQLIDEHGPVVAVLLVAEEWDAGHLLSSDADVTFEDGEIEN